MFIFGTSQSYLIREVMRDITVALPAQQRCAQTISVNVLKRGFTVAFRKMLISGVREEPCMVAFFSGCDSKRREMGEVQFLSPRFLINGQASLDLYRT